MGLLIGELNSNIESIEFTDIELDMCDIEVEDIHCFYANDILTHNCSMDFSGQEVVIATNYSLEPNWLEPLKSGGDIHKSVAIKMFGLENYNKETRKKAKFSNFSLLYLGTWKALQSASKMSEKDSKESYTLFWKAMVTLSNWIERTIRKVMMEQDGTVYSYFKRPRRLKYYLSSQNSNLKEFGKRSVISHTIQATGSDIMRICLVKLYNKIFSNPENLKEIQFGGCVHDEINTVVRKDCIYKWYKVINEIMTIKMPDWALPLNTSVEFGTSYGYLFPFVLDDKGVFVPKRM